MMWIVLGVGLVGKPGTAILTALVQALMVVSLGFFGTHGAVSLLTYALPGLAVEFVMFISRHRGCCAGCCFAGGIAANISGTFLVNLVFFRLPLVPLVLTLSAATLSGGLGGLIAYSAVKQFKREGVFYNKLPEQSAERQIVQGQRVQILKRKELPHE